MTAAKKLVIVESPAKGKTIEKFLGKNYKVIASQGHVRDLPKSQLGVDVDNDFAMKYITIRGRGDILADIRKEAKKASAVYLATDPDREGEAISWHLANVLGIDPSKKCRVEFHEITKNAVKEAINHPRAIDMDRVDAQQARRALDRLVGYQISPLLWAKIKKHLSAGRVQSVATRLIVERENEIEAFIPEEYWEIESDFIVPNTSGKKARYHAKLSSVKGKKTSISNQKEAETVKNKILKDSFLVKTIKYGEKIKRPQPPFTTSSLQQEASKKLNFSTAKTMQVVQQLYEGVDLGREGTVGLVTYIRTDSVRISQEAVSNAKEHILNAYGEGYYPEKPNTYKGRSNAQDAHEAIRPTDCERIPENISAHLTKDQFKLYQLIYNRFIASQMNPARFSTLTVDIAGKDTVLRYYGEHLDFDGYRRLYEETLEDETGEKDSILPELQEGQKMNFTEVRTNQFFTQPPVRYTEASLVKALEENGIGRPSTYAPTITTIISRGYVSKEKKRLYPTELGIMVNSMMTKYFGSIIETQFTAALESKLDHVEEGGQDWHAILHEFYPPFEQMLHQAESQIEKVQIQDEVSDIPCELCGAMMVYKVGRFGRFLACPNFPKCKNTQTINQYLETPCPKCGGRLMQKTSRKNRRFYGCERYPDCDFISWEMPIMEKCPKCGSYMVKKPGKQGTVIHLCANETCRHKEIIEINSDEE